MNQHVTWNDDCQYYYYEYPIKALLTPNTCNRSDSTHGAIDLYTESHRIGANMSFGPQ